MNRSINNQTEVIELQYLKLGDGENIAGEQETVTQRWVVEFLGFDPKTNTDEYGRVVLHSRENINRVNRQPTKREY